jgi:hypothetical protein
LWQFTVGGAWFYGGELTFGNNGGTGTGLASLFNGQWSLGAALGRGFGVNASLALANAGCEQPKVEAFRTASFSSILPTGLFSAGETLTKTSNGETSKEVEVDRNFGPVSVGIAVANENGKKSASPVISVGTPISVFMGSGRILYSPQGYSASETPTSGSGGSAN